MSGRVIVFGSINLDLVSTVPSLPKRGETLKAMDLAKLPGGKGANQALAAKQADAKHSIEVLMVGAVGKDEFAETALSNLGSQDVNIDHIQKVDAPTGLAFIVVDDAGENNIIIHAGANAKAKAAQIDGLEIGSGDVLVTQQEVQLSEIWQVHWKAKQAGTTVIHNAAPATPSTLPLEAIGNIDWLIVNETEALSVAQSAGMTATSPDQAAKDLASHLDTQVILTLGERGATAMTETGSIHAPAKPVQVIDTTGAGDAFVGSFASALLMGTTIKLALEQAVEFSGEACRHKGAQKSAD